MECLVGTILFPLVAGCGWAVVQVLSRWSRKVLWLGLWGRLLLGKGLLASSGGG